MVASRTHSGFPSFGNSMAPLLQDGDVIYLAQLPFHKLKVNDIVTFRRRSTLITHRIIYKTPRYAITKGDGNLNTDGKVRPYEILGILRGVKRNTQLIDHENIYLIQSSLYFRYMVEVNRLLAKNNIQFVFLKGLPLHLYFERSHPRRYYADCDILIKRDVFTKVEELLRTLGYKKHNDNFSALHAKLKDKISEISFYKVVDGVSITLDVHLEPVFLMVQIGTLDALYPQNLVDELGNDFLHERRMVTIHGQKFPILSPAHLLLYLALHFFHDNYTGYYKIEFLSGIMKKYLQDKNTLLLLTGIIRYYKVQNFVFPTYYFLNKYYKTRIPPWFLAQITPDNKQFAYIKKHVVKKNIFRETTRLKAGIERFVLLFFLSPHRLHKKIRVFFNPLVAYTVLWVLQKRIEIIVSKR